MGKKSKNRFYAYRTETEDGVVDSWNECESIVKGRKARYRGFADRDSAMKWLANGAVYENREVEKAEALNDYPTDAVFFDSGTGPGRGTEIRVTDRDGIPILHLAEHEIESLTPEGNLILEPGRTNNYGELLSCLLAIKVAEILGSKHVYGDSRLVTEYWSKGYVSKLKRISDPDLARLSRQTTRARKSFESSGGVIGHVKGRFNPADLGFHKD